MYTKKLIGTFCCSSRLSLDDVRDLGELQEIAKVFLMVEGVLGDRMGGNCEIFDIFPHNICRIRCVDQSKHRRN